MNKYLYIILTIMSLLSTEVTFGQSSLDDRYNKLYEGLTPEEIERKKKEQEEMTDTLGGKKKNRPKKPYSSYLFPDSVAKQTKIFAWKYTPYFNSVERVKVDTMLNDFSHDYFFQAKEGSLGSIYLGNLGAPTVPLAYYERRNNDFKLAFLNAYKEYLYSPDNVIFYNSKVAFTQFTYITSGQRDRAEEDFRLTHAQNISPSTDFNITYRNNRTRGMYENQQSINKNFSFAFNHLGKRYTTHFGYIFNSGEMRENGGIKNIGEVLDTVIDMPQNILINLKDAKTRFKGNGFYWTQSLAIPLSGLKSRDSLSIDTTQINVMSSLDSIRMLRKQRTLNSDLDQRTTLFFGTSIEYDSYKKIYTDTKAQSGDYYKNWYIDPAITNDSIRETNMNLKFFTQFQPYDREGVLSLVGGGIGLDNSGYYYFKPGDYLSGGAKTSKSSTFVYGEAEGKFREYMAWNATIKYFPLGYRSQDLSFAGNLALNANVKRKKPISLLLSASFDTQSPSYWVRNFYSNHYKWNNDFVKETRTNLEARLKIESIHLEIGFNQLLSTNTIYYNKEALPEQSSEAVSVSSAYLYKDFVVGGLHLQHKLLAQFSSNEDIAPVPFLGIDISYFYRFTVVKNALDMEFGINGSYNTKYYGYGYNPATSQFYNQQIYKVGDYPMLDVFATGKWKRLRFILKLQNVNYEIFGGRNYFDVSSYPLNRRMLKFGISWSFYN